MEKANLRIKVLQHELNRIQMDNAALQDDDDDDDDLDEGEGIKAEIRELEQANAARQAKLDEYEKHKKWNVDNLCHVVEEKTIVGTKVTTKYTPDGFVAPTDSLKPEAKVEAPASEPALLLRPKTRTRQRRSLPSKQEAPSAAATLRKRLHPPLQLAQQSQLQIPSRAQRRISEVSIHTTSLPSSMQTWWKNS